MTDYHPNRFNIIRHAGEPVKAVNLKGKTVYREEQFFLPDRGLFVRAAQYDNHFIYENKNVKDVGPTFMCTCGSAAVITGYQAYKSDASPTTGLGIVPGELMVCLNHITFGRHADGSS